jgi:hypothetical protein
MAQQFKLELEFTTTFDGQMPPTEENPPPIENILGRFFQEFLNSPEAFCANVWTYLVNMIYEEKDDVLAEHLKLFPLFKATFNEDGHYYQNPVDTGGETKKIMSFLYPSFIVLDNVRLVYPPAETKVEKSTGTPC